MLRPASSRLKKCGLVSGVVVQALALSWLSSRSALGHDVGSLNDESSGSNGAYGVTTSSGARAAAEHAQQTFSQLRQALWSQSYPSSNAGAERAPSAAAPASPQKSENGFDAGLRPALLRQPEAENAAAEPSKPPASAASNIFNPFFNRGSARERPHGPSSAPATKSSPGFLASIGGFFQGLWGAVSNEINKDQGPPASQAICGGWKPSVNDPLAPEFNVLLKAIGATHANWCPKISPISRLSPAERIKRLGATAPNSSFAARAAAASPGVIVNFLASPYVPATIDWRHHNGKDAVTPVKDQGQCGSCWAFATTEGLESQMIIHGAYSGLPVLGTGAPQMSPQTLLSCGGAGSCNGGSPDQASDFIEKTGLPPDDFFPYTTAYFGASPSCSLAMPGWQAQSVKIGSWTPVEATVDALKQAVASYGPIETTFKVYDDFYNYGSGVYSYTSGGFDGWHSVQIVGYDDSSKSFLVRNSWNIFWGEEGYFQIAYSEVGGKTQFGSDSIAYHGVIGNESLLEQVVLTLAAPTMFMVGGAEATGQALAGDFQSWGKGLSGIGTSITGFFASL